MENQMATNCGTFP